MIKSIWNIIKGDNEMSNLSKKEATEKAYELLDQFNYDVLGPEGSGKAWRKSKMGN